MPKTPVEDPLAVFDAAVNDALAAFDAAAAKKRARPTVGLPMEQGPRAGSRGESMTALAIDAVTGVAEGLGGIVGLGLDAIRDISTAGPIRRGVKIALKKARGEEVEPEDYRPPMAVTETATRAADDFRTTARRVTGADVEIGPIGDVVRVLGNIVAPGPELLSASKGAVRMAPEAIETATREGAEIAVKDLAKNADELPFDVDGYVAEQMASREAARSSGATGIVAKGRSFLADAKRKLVDFAAPIEDVLNETIKKEGIELAPSKDITNQIDRVLRAPTIAGQFAKDGGLVDVIKQVPDLEKLDQYLIAKHAQTVEGAGIKTGRDLAKDAKLIEALAPEYEKFAQQATGYARTLLDYSVDSGLVSRELAEHLKEIYPDYIPLQRVFAEVERAPGYYGSKGVASVSQQTIVRRMVGSSREIESPIESILTKTNDAVRQGEKNKAARMLAGYKDLPGNPFQLRELKAGEEAAHSVSFLDQGKKRTFATTKEVATAAKALDVERLNILGKILALPVRVAKAGITGLNIPFIVSNIARDQLTGAINSSRALATSVLNPKNFTRAVFEAVNHGDLFDEVVREGGMWTSFDIARDQVSKSVAQVRASRSVASRVAYTVRNPSQLLRAVEDLLARSEELTRIQQYSGTKAKLIAEGMPEAEARIAAARAARENTANFARRGEWGTVLNSAFLYLNAGIQGSRQLIRSVATRPKATAAKIAATVFLPVSVATAWNLFDRKRRAAYEDIATFEKDHNLIIVPDDPVKDEKGRWNVIKIPIAPGLDNLSAFPRRAIEQAFDQDEVRAAEIATALIGSVSPVQPAKGELLSALTPQIVKPSIEVATNTNLFTGRQIVPGGMRNRPPEDQVFPHTSGTARKVGEALDVSPLKVEHFVRSTAGGVGSQALNAFDRALAAAGVITEDQVGGESVPEALQRRFGKAFGGEKRRRAKAQRD